MTHSNSKEYSIDFQALLNSSNDSFSTDKEDNIIALQNKFNALKKAFVNERSEREIKEKELENLQKKSDILTIELNEKKEVNQKLKTDIEEIQYKIIAERNISEKEKKTAKDPSTEKRQSFQSLKEATKEFMEFKKLERNLQEMQKEYNSLVEKLKLSDEKVELIKKECDRKKERWNQRLKKLIELKERKESRITPLSLDLTNATATNAGLREDNDFLEKSIQEKKSIILQYKNQIEGLMKNKDEKKFSVEEKSKEVSSLEYEVQKIKEKIADLRIRETELESKMQTFDLYRVGNFTSIPVQLILRKNVKDDLILEIEYPSEKVHMNVLGLVDFAINKNTPTRFSLSYSLDDRNNEYCEFETSSIQECEKVYNYMTEFLGNAEDRNKDKKQVHFARKETMKALADVVSFMGI